MTDQNEYNKPPNRRWSGPRHLPGVSGAATLETQGLRKIQVCVRSLFNDGGIITIDGKVGVGKSFGTAHVLENMNIPVYWAEMPASPRGNEANRLIYKAVTGRDPGRRTTGYVLTEETVDVLNDLHAVIVIDEASNLTTEAMRQVRYLHDRPSTTVLLVLIGYNIESQVAKVPELQSRVARRITVKELSGAELRKFLPEFHPILRNTDQAILVKLAEYAKGNLRSWARILEVSKNLNIPIEHGIDARSLMLIEDSISGKRVA